MSEREPGFDDLQACFEGAVPVVIATVSGDGTPNVTYLSKAHRVDDRRVALSNQFMSKSAQNLAEHPRASLLFLDPLTMDEFRVEIAYERTERRGRVFEELRRDVDAIAAMTGMQDVFRLRSADVYRMEHVEAVPAGERADGTSGAPPLAADRGPAPTMSAVAELCARLDRCGDLDTLVRVAVDGLAQLLGHEHSMVLLLDEAGERLFTLATHGYDREGVGAEVLVGDGVIGIAARTASPQRVGNARQMAKYSRSIRASFETAGDIEPGREVPWPGLADVDSCVAVPIRALGHLVGVLAVESDRPARYTADDEAALTVVASILANAIETLRSEARDEVDPAEPAAPSPTPAPDAGDAVHVRFFAADGSTFLEGDYLIKGVAGRILWSLLRQHDAEGRTDFTNREVRLDPSLDLPDFRDNFESRLILLKRRLDERDAPIRIEKTGRGRFRLVLQTPVHLEER